jgi:hypothetical protein
MWKAVGYEVIEVTVWPSKGRSLRKKNRLLEK